MLLKPVLFQCNKIELIRSCKLAIELILIHEIAETSIASSSFDEFAVPRFRQIAELSRRNVADVDLMGSVGRGPTEASELIFQLRFEGRVPPELARWFGPITNEIRYVSQ